MTLFLSYFPPHMCFHLVFHVLLLEPYDLNFIPYCAFSRPPRIELDEALDYELKTILGTQNCAQQIALFC